MVPVPFVDADKKPGDFTGYFGNRPFTSFQKWRRPKNRAEISNAPDQAFINSGVKKVMFLTLRVFSLTGGIEKVSKVAGKALYELCEDAGKNIAVYSMYDETNDMDEKYFPKNTLRVLAFRGCGLLKKRCLKESKMMSLFSATLTCCRSVTW